MFNVQLALRYEDYSDFGSDINWKVATRFEPVSGFALRASASTGFRAPSLQQQFYAAQATNNVRPHVNQVHVFYRAKLIDLTFAPGEESLEVALFEEAAIPWKEIAFRTVGLTLKHWFEDRRQGAFGFHAGDVVAPAPRI